MKNKRARLPRVVANRQVRRNVQVMMRYLGVVIVLMLVYTQLFHFFMTHFEGRTYSWVTGLYWTLTVMSTLGFGDITFTTDAGRIFTMVVLITGVVMLLVVLPFIFIRLAPWLEARLRMSAPRRVPADTRGHVILCAYDPIAPGLMARMEQEGIPYFLLEPDPVVASDRLVHGQSVVQGDIESKRTYQALRVDRARMVVANSQDTINTNITLTVREVAPSVPIVALVEDDRSIDVLEFSGATRVLPLKQWLGEQLASRVNAMHAQLHPLGRYEDLLLAELPLHHIPLAGKTIRETHLREHTGVSIVGVWERGELLPARPDLRLTESSVAVIIGTEAQFELLNDLLMIYDINPNPVLVIGGGAVGTAAIRALARKETPVHLVDKDPMVCARLRGLCKAVFTGHAAALEVLQEAGIMTAPSVILTTNDDAMNIYLTSYCRHLNPDLHIVSRITHERNVKALYRAGADFVLSYHSLGVEAIFSILKNKELVVLGERVDLFAVPLPPALYGKTLAESEIGAHTGLNVIAVRRNNRIDTHLSAATVLTPDSELLMIGDLDQRRQFNSLFR